VLQYGKKRIRLYPRPAPCKNVSDAAQGSVKNCKFDGPEPRVALTVPEYKV
jgi:hypothetical protein